MKQKTLIIAALVSAGLISLTALNSCGGSASSSASGIAESAISSPFAQATASGTLTFQAKSRTFGASYEERKDALEALVSEKSDASKCSFTIDLRLEDAYADCYGPNLFLASGTHADGTFATPPPPNPLPTGDLGLWSSTSAATGEACTAAQINKLVEVRTRSAFTSQLIGSTLICFTQSSGLTIPAAEGETLTLDAAQLTDFGFTDSAGKIFAPESAVVSYITDSNSNPGLQYNVSGKIDGKDFSVIFRYAENTSGGYAGTASYFFREPGTNEGNCNSATGITPAGRMTFAKANSDANVQIRLDHAHFCGTTYNPLTAESSTAINGCDKYNETYDGDSDINGWGANYNRVVFNYDPDTLVGKYSLAWQAGRMDQWTRVFNAEITSETAGTGYFGFGPDISTIASSVCTQSADLGKITKMICNWAGPNSINANRQPVDYVQRQEMTFTSGKWSPVSATEKIRYFPSNSCDATGSTSLVYCAVTTNNATACPSTHTHSNDSANATDPRNNLEPLATYTSGWTAPTSPTF